MDLNILIIIIYFVFLIAIGWVFRSLTKSTSDYFRGGGQMLWWMVGASAFMTQFSAWTFTGAAGKAYNDGLAVALIFVANAFGYLMNYLYFAPKMRQLRVVTVIDAVRLRFGSKNEQVFAWLNIPTTIVQAGIWLNALAIITTAVLDVDMTTTIVVTGLVVLVMSVTGGAWAVIASDFMQMVVIMAVTLICAVMGIVEAGGIAPVIERFPRDFVAGSDLNYFSVFAIWAVFIFIKQFAINNNMLYAYRYLAAKDSSNARKGALLACVLMIIGPFIWFIPSWFLAGTGVDMNQLHPEMGSKAADAVYLVFVELYMPAGMVGLLLAAMFAATMSSMDSGLNRNAGILVKNFYEPLLRPRATEKELLLVSKITSAIFGGMIILVALFINSLKGLSLFDAMMYVGALLSFPMIIPGLFGFFIKKTPDWAGWGTLVVGGLVSYFVGFVLQAQHVEQFFGLDVAFTSREWSDLSIAISLMAHLVITGGFFCLSVFFYRGLAAGRQQDVDKFFHNLDTPLVNESTEQQQLDNRQRVLLGRMISVLGVFIMALVAIPNPFWGRMVFLACGFIVFAVGLLLFNAVDKSYEQDALPKGATNV
ncbi:transporter [Marinobacterium aestuarii]|uniref:Transporter n=1 Tax=Marinobacterium aestuarii TaxID=1821621 RepID=A0A1A9EUT9_9GAMM|nr:sodium:solute symporter family protein [Marinobacterium aestuarii]ANG61401.1 transporter [Marinobacterium aestuarii]